MGHAIIPDVHADHGRLERTLLAAGFEPAGPAYRHPGGETALFLGDLIDNGPENARVIATVRAMVDDGEALCLMGNHELNALLLHGEHRERSEKNLRQHASFLREFRFGEAATADALRWFLTLPLRADLGHFRAAHAFWGDDEILSSLTAQENGALITRLDPGLMQDLAAERGAIALAVLDVTKGPEIVLPPGGFGFSDLYGHWRAKGRMRWWGGPDFGSWSEAMISLGPDARLPEWPPGPDVGARAYDPSAPTLLFGHYKMTDGDPQVAPNAICLDFPARAPFAAVDRSGQIILMDASGPEPDGLAP